MNRVLRKVIGRDGQHPSRLQTRRGEFATIESYLSLLPSIVSRVAGQSPRPWLAPAAVTFLNKELRPSDQMLEFGGGASTAWFADRIGRLATVEPDPAWYEHIRTTTADRDNVHLLLTTIAAAMADPPLSPTVVLVDHDGGAEDPSRCAVSIWASTLTPAPRLIVLDDSDTPDLRDVFDRLEPLYEARAFHGFKARPLHLIETTVFVRRDATQ